MLYTLNQIHHNYDDGGDYYYEILYMECMHLLLKLFQREIFHYFLS